MLGRCASPATGAAAQGARQYGAKRFDALGEMEHRRTEGLATREGQQLPGQDLAALHRPLDRLRG
jgi:hypothetical protein